jgi:hypothetical protein
MASKPRYAVKINDWSNQEALIGTFTLHERAAALAASINAEIEKRNRGNVQGYASVVLIEPTRTAAEIAEWATGYGADDEEQAEWERRANAEIGGAP